MSDQEKPTEERRLKETPKQKTVKFERPPYSSQVFSRENKEKFDDLPGYVRQLVGRVVDHGNLPLAATEAGIGDRYKSIDFSGESNKSLMDALNEGGLTPSFLVKQMAMCLEGLTGKEDKDGNPIIDLKTKIKTIELILKLRGDFNAPAQDDTGSVLEMFKKEDESK